MKSTPPEQNRRILIVDDNPTIHADFRKILCPEDSHDPNVNDMAAVIFKRNKPAVEQSAFELEFAFQGQEALAMVEKAMAAGRPYAMAFVDVRMPPGWDGVETIARIWKVYPELQVIVCTAYADYSWAEMRAKVGQPDSLLILKKPFDNVEVQQLAHSLTKKWMLNQQTKFQLAELTEANKSLAALEKRFSTAFHESPLPSGIQSLPDLRFVDVNHRLATIAGYQPEEMIGRCPAELFLWENPAVADQWYEAALGQNLVRDKEANIRTQGGQLHQVRVSLCPFNLGDRSHVLLLAQDVSEQAILERQLRQAQKMEAIGQLAAGVAHDFNNILTVIQGHTGLMQSRLDPSSPLKKSLNEVGSATERASQLVKQLLMFSRKQVMQFRHTDLNDTLSNVIKMLERLLGEQVKLEFLPQNGLPAIYADNSMLEQIVMNLAVNARDAMPSGGSVKIGTSLWKGCPPVAIKPDRPEKEYICLTFSDSGMGMDTQTIPRIFEPFFTTKPPGKGTGLGLSTVLGIVQQHQGIVDVESQPNEGTTFRIYFPVSQQRAAEKIETTIDTILPCGNETILVAEDEEALREMVSLILRGQGYTVLEAASAADALDVWRQASRPIDLLVTDMVMPGGILGGELAQRLIEKSPGLKVIYTSGYTPGMAGKDASLLQESNFLPKPYSIGKLSKLVRECLDAPNTPQGVMNDAA